VKLFVNLYRSDRGVLVEDVPAGDSRMELELDGQVARVAAALMALASYELSIFLGRLFMAGVAEGQRAARSASPPSPAPDA